MIKVTTLDKEFIERKLDAITLYDERAEQILQSSESEILADFLKLHSLERLIQLIVDEMVDINTHIIRHGNFETPDDFQSSFRVLADADVFPHKFADQIAPTVGLRNRLVHRYDSVNPDVLIRMSKKEADDFRAYVKYIRAVLF